jgi:DMSO/TMAO reductase YedYZ molybdopterin-dependent catalytic subunit
VLRDGIQCDEVHEYQRSLGLAEARRDDVLLAYAMNGAPLQPQHGFQAVFRSLFLPTCA